MHGADRDIVWLQRDFGIYICNMFDTGQVCTLKSLIVWVYVSLVLLFVSVRKDLIL
jgi:ribonuclease D